MNKKYAFISDYVRLDVVYEYGGIYLDIDVELIKSLNDLLKYKCFLGTEELGRVATGLGFGAVPRHWFIKENKKYYEEKIFIVNNRLRLEICVDITTTLLKKYGLSNSSNNQKIKDIVIFTPDYFCPKIYTTNKLKITKNTYSIHHFVSTWKSKYKIIRDIKYLKMRVIIILKKFLNIL